VVIWVYTHAPGGDIMSCYMLDEEDFQKIADWLFTKSLENNSPYLYTIKDFLGLDSFTTEQDIEITIKHYIRRLYNLNSLALTTRYKEKYDPCEKDKFLAKYAFDLKDKDVLNIMSRLRYQLAEDFTGETHTFKRFDKLIGRLSEKFIWKY